ncbi:PqqD family protein [Bacillus sp. AC79A.1]
MKPTKNPFVKSRAIQGKFYVVNNREAYILDEVGQCVWNKIDGETDLDFIIKEIAGQFNVDIGTVEQDIKEYLEELKENNLITI